MGALKRKIQRESNFAQGFLHLCSCRGSLSGGKETIVGGAVVSFLFVSKNLGVKQEKRGVECQALKFGRILK